VAPARAQSRTLGQSKLNKGLEHAFKRWYDSDYSNVATCTATQVVVIIEHARCRQRPPWVHPTGEGVWKANVAGDGRARTRTRIHFSTAWEAKEATIIGLIPLFQLNPLFQPIPLFQPPANRRAGYRTRMTQKMTEGGWVPEEDFSLWGLAGLSRSPRHAFLRYHNAILKR
jgi:hypothetical protein